MKYAGKLSTVRAFFLITVTLSVAITGCKQQGEPDAAAQAPLPAGLLLTREPPGARPVEDVKKGAKVGDAVTIRGVVGGSKDPFVEGRAMFTLMGFGLKPCGAGSPMPDCATPWDYCCDLPGDIAAHSATVQFVDANEKPLRVSLKGKGGIKELSELIVVGKVKQVEGKLLIVNATGVYVAKS